MWSLVHASVGARGSHSRSKLWRRSPSSCWATLRTAVAGMGGAGKRTVGGTDQRRPPSSRFTASGSGPSAQSPDGRARRVGCAARRPVWRDGQYGLVVTVALYTACNSQGPPDSSGV